jgi:anthranilate phosphoribosyltransferase
VIAQALARVQRGALLERAEMRDVVRAIACEECDPALVEALLVALHQRGESVDEVAGAAEAMRELAVKLPAAPPDAVDVVGTGGDRAGTFNISTVAALVVAGAGVPVAKHGNRAATSACGSADVLEALGVRIDAPPERMAAAVREVGFGFLFARACHPAMARVAPIRARIAHPTLFNRLGPLCNPMRVRRQLVGVAQAALLEPTRDALVALGSDRVWVAHAEDGLDELSLTGPARVAAFVDGRAERFPLDPARWLPRAPTEALAGGDPTTNAAIARAVLGGEPGPKRDVVLLNAGVALVVAGRAREPGEGIALARGAIDSGAARRVLERFVAFAQEGAAA